MVLAADLYTRPALTALSVSFLVGSIIVDHFKTFVILAGCQLVLYSPLVILSFLFAYFEAGNEGVGYLLEVIGMKERHPDYGEPNNTWVEFLIGVLFVNASAGSIAFVPLIMLFCCLAVITITFINSAMEGAFMRACAEVYACRAPDWKRCLSAGRKRMVTIACLKILIFLVFAGVTSVWFVLMILPGVVDESAKASHGMIVLTIILVLVPFTMAFSVAMVGAKSAIMVENLSARQSMKQSLRLFLLSPGFIFRSNYVFMFLVHVVGCYSIRPILGSVVAWAMSMIFTFFPLTSM